MASADTFVTPTGPTTPASRADVPPAQRTYPGVLRRQVASELRLVFGRRRNLAMLLLVSLVPIFLGIAIKISTPKNGDGPPFVSQLTGNGLFLAFTALAVCLPVFLPLSIAVVSGDAIAGEAGAGTLRYLLSIPVARGRLLAIKTVGILAYLGVAVLLITVIGMITGLALFGSHGVTLLSGQTVSFADGLLRALGIALFVFLDMVGLAGIGLFFSTLTEVPVGAMAATVVVAITSAILDSVPQLGVVRDILLTHYWLSFDELLRTGPHLGSVAGWCAVPLGYAVLFGSAAWARITTSDVTG